MQHSPRHLEGLARQLLEEVDMDAPIDAFALAEACGLVLKPWGKTHSEIDLDRGVIRYPSKARAERAARQIVHEVSHWTLVRAGESDEDEEDVDYLALALLIPRPRYLRDLAEVGHELPELKRRHPSASHQALAIRIVHLSAAYASVWDAGRLRASYGTDDAAADAELVSRVLESGEPIRGRVSAFPVFDGAFRRVVVIGRAA